MVIELTAADPSSLGPVARKVADALRGVSGVVAQSVNDGVIPAGDALEVQVDPAAAASQGDTVSDIQSQLQQYLAGSVVTRYVGNLQSVGVRVWLDPASRPLYRAQLDGLLMRSPAGRMFSLGSVAQIHVVNGQPQITRDNLAQVVAVTAEIDGDHDLGSVIARSARH